MGSSSSGGAAMNIFLTPQSNFSLTPIFLCVMTLSHLGLNPQSWSTCGKRRRGASALGPHSLSFRQLKSRAVHRRRRPVKATAWSLTTAVLRKLCTSPILQSPNHDKLHGTKTVHSCQTLAGTEANPTTQHSVEKAGGDHSPRLWSSTG